MGWGGGDWGTRALLQGKCLDRRDSSRLWLLLFTQRLEPRPWPAQRSMEAPSSSDPHSPRSGCPLHTHLLGLCADSGADMAPGSTPHKYRESRDLRGLPWLQAALLLCCLESITRELCFGPVAVSAP